MTEKTPVIITVIAQVCANTMFLIQDHKSHDIIVDYFLAGARKVEDLNALND